MPRKKSPSAVPLPTIHLIRGQRVVLDSDLAALYGVTTKVFNQTIRRNSKRFPEDFLLRLTHQEFANLKSQNVTSSLEILKPLRSQSPTETRHRHGGSRKLPWAFAEHGAIMAATLLRSPQAVSMSVFVVRAFVRMREELLTNAVILKRIAQMDKKLLEHDVVLQDVIEKLLPLLTPPDLPRKRRIGFHDGNR